MKLWKRITAMFRPRPVVDPDEDAVRVKLDQGEGRMAGRLSRLTGKVRDEVFAESYRRADAARRDALQVEADSMRPRR